MGKSELVKTAFEAAAQRYAAVGVDVQKAMDQLQRIQLSLHCWQTDDVVGFENPDGSGTQTTPKKDFVVDFIKEEKGAKYPYLVEYNRGTRRYFKKIVQI